MLIAGSQDGVYAVTGVLDGEGATADRVLDAGATMRVRQFPAFDGVFAATRTGLYHSLDGEAWTDLGVPTEAVYSVGASPDGRLYAGTQPAAIYVAEADGGAGLDALEWRQLDGVQSLPSRDDWRLPRHDDLAHVRDVHVHPDAPDRVVAGVEVGGVHVSEDGGETWTERRGEVDDDVHELRVVGPEEFVAATGFGLFRSTDAGRSWTQLNRDADQQYVRSVFATDDAVYAGTALSNTTTWTEDDADPALFVLEDDTSAQRVDHPRPGETVTGMTAVDGGVVAATHHGTLLVQERAATGGDAEWRVAGSLPVDRQLDSSYTPLAWVEA
jgi:hypothetical protein